MKTQFKHIFIALFALMVASGDVWGSELKDHEDFIELIFKDLGGEAQRVGSTTWKVEVELDKLDNHTSAIVDFFNTLPPSDPLFPEKQGVRGAFTNESFANSSFNGIKKGFLETTIRNFLQDGILKVKGNKCEIGQSLSSFLDFEVCLPQSLTVSPVTSANMNDVDGEKGPGRKLLPESEVNTELTTQFINYCTQVFGPHGFSVDGIQITNSGHVLRWTVDVDTTDEEKLFGEICGAWQASGKSLEQELEHLNAAKALLQRSSPTLLPRAQLSSNKFWSETPLAGEDAKDLSSKFNTLLKEEGVKYGGSAIIYTDGRYYIPGASLEEAAKIQKASLRLSHYAASKNVQAQVKAYQVLEQLKQEFLSAAKDIPPSFTFNSIPREFRAQLGQMKPMINALVEALKQARNGDEADPLVQLEALSDAFKAGENNVAKLVSALGGIVNEGNSNEMEILGSIKSMEPTQTDPAQVEIVRAWVKQLNALKVSACLAKLGEVGPAFEAWREQNKRIQIAFGVVPFTMLEDPDYAQASYKFILGYINNKAQKAVDAQVQQLENLVNNFSVIKGALTELRQYQEVGLREDQLQAQLETIGGILKVSEENLSRLKGKALPEIEDPSGRKNRPDYLYEYLQKIKEQADANQGVMMKLVPLLLELNQKVGNHRQRTFNYIIFRQGLVEQGVIPKDLFLLHPKD